MTLNLKRQRILVLFCCNFRLRCTAHISRVNCAEMAEDKPGQPAYSLWNF